MVRHRPVWVLTSLAFGDAASAGGANISPPAHTPVRTAPANARRPDEVSMAVPPVDSLSDSRLTSTTVRAHEYPTTSFVGSSPPEGGGDDAVQRDQRRAFQPGRFAVE